MFARSRFNTAFLFAPSLISLLLVTAQAQAAVRESMSLNGTWQMAKVASLDSPPPDAGWKDTPVPGTTAGYNYERAWFKRTFTVDESWKGKRIVLRFGGVKFRSTIRVNNKDVGGCLNGYDAFEVDITDAVRFGEKNELLVGVYDWTGLFDGAHMNLPAHADWIKLRTMPRDRVLAPIGGRFDLYGIWDDVSVAATPRVHIDHCAVRASVRESKLTLNATVANGSTESFRGKVSALIYPYDGTPRKANGTWPRGAAPVATSASVSVEAPAGGAGVVAIEFSKPPLDLWSPDHPKLYVVELAIDGKNGDVYQERIGYREFWTEGGDFYLNGVKSHLLGRSWWPPDQPASHEAIVSQIQKLKEMHVTCFRTHTQPWPEAWYDVADELGLLMIAEGAIFKDDETYRVNDPRFWEAYGRHLTTMVDHLGNHPSVVMWSLENEFYGLKAKKGTPVETHLADMARLVKKADPTRPVFFESDGDPGGAADVIGMHYPNEFPERRLWPNEAYWMESANASRSDRMFWNGSSFLWDRKKPLYIGEFLWIPDETAASATLFYGDEVYTAPRTYHFRAIADAWRMQILAYRHYGVSGFAPWGYDYIKPDGERKVDLLAQRDMYRPLAAFIREYDHRFFSESSVERTVELFNDTAVDRPDAQLEWAVVKEDKVLVSDKRAVALAAGSHQELAIAVKMPSVTERTDFSLRLTLSAEGKEQFREQWPITLFPSKTHWAAPAAPLFIYDPSKHLAAVLGKAGVKYESVADADAWNGKGVLIVAEQVPSKTQKADDAIPRLGELRARGDSLSRKVRAGGKVLVLAQTSDSADLLPVQLSPTSSTMAFPQMPDHPILHGFQSGDFSFWRGDHLVSRQEPPRPDRGAGLPLVVTGTAQGVSHAPLLEIPDGKGAWLVCQLLVQSKIDTEPVARPLLEAMIDYLARYAPREGATVAAAPEALRENLDRCNVDYTPLADWSALHWPQDRLLILQADAAEVEKRTPVLKSFLEAGGTVLWHKPTQAEFAAVSTALHLPVQYQAFHGAVTRAEGHSSWVESIVREDLYWVDPLSPSTAPAGAATKSAADGIFVSTAKAEAGPSIDATQGVKLEGPVVKIQGKEVVFGSNGIARWPLEITETGTYALTLLARGTSAGGIYPTAEVSLDGKMLGAVEVTAVKPDYFAVSIRAEKGKHVLGVAFTNDGKSGKEDRNLYVSGYAIAKQGESGAFETLSTPAALVRIPVGKGNLVVNTIAWDTPGNNILRAERFISGLLGVAGASFRTPAPAVVLEAETMPTNADIGAFVRTPDHVLFGANGFVEQKVNVARQGRYRFTLWAKGTPVNKVYPLVSVQWNGRELGRVECTGEAWGPHEILVELPAGAGALRFAFINDERRPPEDRNLWLDRIEVERVE